ncbi:carbohydrate ABC transporter permease [Cohnella caldifontis]|uniref:carbohydrate ABC transporter permease n=1 Tax=Cohnella caldifontis TaxID=3027471 RepID=UPI0023EBF429|nr:sugar ABC transporter permease [Cohnella sp. YIM B05605]
MRTITGRRTGRSWRGKVDFVKFVAPALLLYSLFFIVPLLQTVVYSFTDWNGIARSRHYIGIDNYANMLKDDLFLGSLRFTLTYAVLYTIGINIVAVALALLLTRSIKSKTALRAVIFTPFLFNDVTVGFLWQFLLGRFMTGLYDKTHLGIFGISWLSNEHLVLYSIIFVKMWQAMGYFMVIYIAGLQLIPKEPLEAAVIDGATGWKQITRITLPLLMPTMAICVFLSITDALHMFPLLMTLTGGGPGHASESVSLYIYNTAFNNQQMGYASSLAVVLAVLVLIITYFQLKVFRGKEVSM